MPRTQKSPSREDGAQRHVVVDGPLHGQRDVDRTIIVGAVLFERHLKLLGAVGYGEREREILAREAEATRVGLVREGLELRVHRKDVNRGAVEVITR